MKKKNICVTALMFLFAIIAILFTHAPIAINSYAQNTATNYFGETLSGSSKIFYNILEEINASGDFKSGNCNKIVTDTSLTNLIEPYKNGNKKLIYDFNSAVKNFELDHPEIFYVNFSKLSLNIGETSSGYVLSIGSGRNANFYYDNASNLQNKTDIETAINEFNENLDLILSNTNGKNAQETVKIVNQNIVNGVTHSFGNNNDGTPTNNSYYVQTAYGAAVNKVATYEGYAKLFKCAMDKKNIPCVIIDGYLANENNKLQSHTWNYVKIDENWYAVDTALNDVDANHKEQFLLCGSEEMFTHFANSKILNTTSILFYPQLYGTAFRKDTNLLSTLRVLTLEQSAELELSYHNKSAEKLKQEDNLFLAVRYKYDTWDKWISLNNLSTNDDFEICDENTYTFISNYTRPCAAQVGVFTYNCANEKYETTPSSENTVALSQIYTIDGLIPTDNSPKIANVTPNLYNDTVLDADKTYNFSITYDKDLQIIGDLGVNISTNRCGNVNNFVSVGNLSFDGSRTVAFIFKASEKYLHNLDTYTFEFSNLVGAQNNLPIKNLTCTFAKKINVEETYSRPQGTPISQIKKPIILTPENLSNNKLTYTDSESVSHQIATNQFNQILLYANETPTTFDILNLLHTSVSSNDILSALTYDLDAKIFGYPIRITNDTKLKVAFNFPNGYNTTSQNVIFQVYHFKKNLSGEIDYTNPETLEKLPSVVTNYGLLVEVNSFSPFTVVAVKKPLEPQIVTKTITTQINTNGGTISANKDGNILTLQESESITYTITANEGYEIEYILLNNERLEISTSITLNYEDLKSDNVLQIGFVATIIKQQEDNDGITDITVDVITYKPNNAPHITANVILIICIVAGSVIVASTVIITLIIARKKAKK